MFRRQKDGDAGGERPSAADRLRPLLFGDVPVDDWAPTDGGTQGHPWDQFARAREALAQHHPKAAVDIWSGLAADPGLESRQVLQAWTFLRQAGRWPNGSESKTVLGVIVEMPLGGGHDLLAAYADGSARYLHHAGTVAVVEAGFSAAAQQAVDVWLEVGRSIVQSIGPWGQEELPALPTGHLRIMMLTPSGPHFGQGPEGQMTADPTVAQFVRAAAALLQVVVGLTRRSDDPVG